MKREPMKVVPTRLPKPLHRAIKVIARQRHQTVSSYIRSVLRRDVEERTKAA